MIFATYQGLDYLMWRNKRFPELKKLLGLSQDVSLYWCISANNIYQAIINTYTIEVNTPALFIMFETETYYRLDAIKWNHYVETQDENLLTDDLFNIEHEDAIEYIVTSIPAKRFEVNTTPCELAKILSDENGKYSKSFLKYGHLIMQSLNNFPNQDKIDKMPIRASEKNIDDKIILLQKFFIVFKAFLLIPLYFAGLDYLGHTVTENYNLKMISLSKAYEIVIRHSGIYVNYGDAENLYKRYKDFYEFIYNTIFSIDKLRPNDPCPCKSGLKYKKCCMRDNKVLYKYLTEKC